MRQSHTLSVGVDSAAATVGADRIRPQHKASLRGACAGSTYSSTPIFVDPYRGVCHPSWCFLKSGVTGGFYPPLQGSYPVTQQTPCSFATGGRLFHQDSISSLEMLPRKPRISASGQFTITRRGRVRLRQNISIKLLPLMRWMPSSRYTGKGWEVATLTNSSTSRTELRRIRNSF